MVSKKELQELILSNSQRAVAVRLGISQKKVCSLLREYRIVSPRKGNHRSDC